MVVLEEEHWETTAILASRRVGGSHSMSSSKHNRRYFDHFEG